MAGGAMDQAYEDGLHLFGKGQFFLASQKFEESAKNGNVDAELCLMMIKVLTQYSLESELADMHDEDYAKLDSLAERGSVSAAYLHGMIFLNSVHFADSNPDNLDTYLELILPSVARGNVDAIYDIADYLPLPDNYADGLEPYDEDLLVMILRALKKAKDGGCDLAGKYFDEEFAKLPDNWKEFVLKNEP